MLQLVHNNTIHTCVHSFSIHPHTKLAVREWANIYWRLWDYSRRELLSSLGVLIWRVESLEDVDHISQLFCYLHLQWNIDEKKADYDVFLEFHEKMQHHKNNFLKMCWVEFSHFFHTEFIQYAQKFSQNVSPEVATYQEDVSLKIAGILDKSV